MLIVGGAEKPQIAELVPAAQGLRLNMINLEKVSGAAAFLRERIHVGTASLITQPDGTAKSFRDSFYFRLKRFFGEIELRRGFLFRLFRLLHQRVPLFLAQMREFPEQVFVKHFGVLMRKKETKPLELFLEVLANHNFEFKFEVVD